jgi:hypothetical protein
VGELLIPVVGTMRQELLSGSYIQADETPVQVQIEEGGGKHHQACGELDATGCHRAKKLDPRRQLTSRTEDRSNFIDRGKL